MGATCESLNSLIPHTAIVAESVAAGHSRQRLPRVQKARLLEPGAATRSRICRRFAACR
jgi:hypothetical protein